MRLVSIILFKKGEKKHTSLNFAVFVVGLQSDIADKKMTQIST